MAIGVGEMVQEVVEAGQMVVGEAVGLGDGNEVGEIGIGGDVLETGALGDFRAMEAYVVEVGAEGSHWAAVVEEWEGMSVVDGEHVHGARGEGEGVFEPEEVGGVGFDALVGWRPIGVGDGGGGGEWRQGVGGSGLEGFEDGIIGEELEEDVVPGVVFPGEGAAGESVDQLVGDQHRVFGGEQCVLDIVVPLDGAGEAGLLLAHAEGWGDFDDMVLEASSSEPAGIMEEGVGEGAVAGTDFDDVPGTRMFAADGMQPCEECWGERAVPSGEGGEGAAGSHHLMRAHVESEFRVVECQAHELLEGDGGVALGEHGVEFRHRLGTRISVDLGSCGENPCVRCGRGAACFRRLCLPLCWGLPWSAMGPGERRTP